MRELLRVGTQYYTHSSVINLASPLPYFVSYRFLALCFSPNLLELFLVVELQTLPLEDVQ